MNLREVLRSTAMRLAARFTLIYVIVLSVSAGAFLWLYGKDVDANLRDDLTREFLQLEGIYAESGIAHLAEAVRQRSGGADQRERVYLLVGADDVVLAGNLHAWPPEAGFTLDGEPHDAWFDDDVIPPTLHDDDALWPVVGGRLRDGSRLLVARNIEGHAALTEFIEFLIEVLGVAVLLALLVAITLAAAISSRFGVIASSAGEIMNGDLSRRVPVSRRNDEFDALAARLNQMLDRIQSLVRGIRETSDNVAHDLRSPLTRLRNRLETGLLEPRGNDEYRTILRDCIDDADSLIRTFNSLLSIAQAEAGNHRSQWQVLDLAGLVSDVTELYRAVAEENGRTLELTRTDKVSVKGGRELLAQALGNLLENAIKFTPQGGTIEVYLVERGDRVEFVVDDTGPGIPADQRERVLQRFVRLDSSRQTPGNGLGLSLVNAVAVLHCGSLSLDDAEHGGLRAVMRLPPMPGPA